LIEIYSDKKSILNELIIKKTWNEIVEIWSEEYKNVMNRKNFEIIEDILFIVKIWDNEYYGFDEFSRQLKQSVENSENKSIWEIFWIEERNDRTEIEKLNSEIDELAKWFYYENDSVPEDWVEDKQCRFDYS
jgi:hypothetical protein